MLHVIYHDNSLLHEMGPTHLEAPIRIRVVDEALRTAPFETKFVEAPYAKKEDLSLVHHQDLINSMELSQHEENHVFTLDTTTNSSTYSASLTAVGGAIDMANNVKSRNYQFGMLRPPGHHSTFQNAMGFCFFNNIAFTARKLEQNGIKRIAIIDVDHHHGNGTQDLFYDSPNILYTSLHADPQVAFPGTGFAQEVGIEDGVGKTVNIPLPIRAKNQEYLYGFDKVILPIVDQFKPEVILISLGLDALNNDPYGILGLTPDCYFEMGLRIGSLAAKHCQNRVAVLLEGGYKYEEMGFATVRFFQGLMDHRQEHVILAESNYRFNQILKVVKDIQSNYWVDI